jgi:hypothetical protein
MIRMVENVMIEGAGVGSRNDDDDEEEKKNVK